IRFPFVVLSSLRSLTFCIFPLVNTNIYSKVWLYRIVLGNGAYPLSYIIVSWSLNPISLKNNACLNDVPVSLPFTVASPTTHTTTPPSFVTRYNSSAIPSKSHSNPLYLRKLSYGGDVTVKSIELFDILRFTFIYSSIIFLLI